MENINSQFAYDTHQLMESSTVRLFFSGEFSSDLITVLLLMAKSNIGGRSVMKKVYNIMIECLENLTKHAYKNKTSQHPAMFVLGKDHEYYYVATGNEIENKHVVHLNDKLSRVNALDKNGLKEWYDGIIKNNSSALNKSDQGIGIIDMALKSENKFEFDFKKLNDENSFFTLKIKVKAEIE
ncbi:MAG: hypothetical protein CMP61_12325 [Flavobacteriales bacterium]|nr:hypothetical protein [Flavobacteriales bacterium]|tara:strand:+ start:26526 stop:27071 length:546 start_codon:yes stop_codon:yes gene_type:complete